MENNNYKSQGEKIFAKRLKELDIQFSYESKKIQIMPAIKTHYTNYKESTYLPDFIFMYKNRLIYIEIKGYYLGVEKLMFRYKFIDCLLDKDNIEFYMLRMINNEFYLYKDRGRVKNKWKVKTFFEILLEE